MAAADSMVDSSSPSSVANNVEERADDKQQADADLLQKKAKRKAQSTNKQQQEDDHHDNSYDSGSGSESSSEDEEDFVDAQAGQEEEEIMPDGDSNADLHALLAFSKSRLENTPKAEPHTSGEEEEEEEHEDGSEDQQNNDDDNNNNNCDSEQSNHEEETPLFETAHSEEDNSSSTTTESPNLNGSDQDNALEIAKQKLAQAEAKAAADDDTDDPAYLLRLAEKKVKEAEEKAKLDEEATSGTVGGVVVKPAVSSTRRSEANSELWALLNYSKMRVETGATPQLAKKATAPTTQKDDISVSSKLSKSSKRSLNSKKSNTSKMSHSNSETKVTINVDEGGLPKSAERDAPVPDVTGDDNASVDSLENSVEDEDEDEELRSSRSDGEDESSDDDDDDDDEEEEMPSFLQDDDGIDPEETKRLYEEAKFKAASILSVSEEKLTDVQMLQAIAIAEEAARSGEEKFSTKRSLFKLSEAKLEDLRSFLDFGENKEKASTTPSTATRTVETPGWGIGRGRFAKKVGTMFSDFRDKCHELDERKLREREGKPTNVELLDAAMVSIKKELDEFESVVRKKTGTQPRKEYNLTDAS